VHRRQAIREAAAAAIAAIAATVDQERVARVSAPDRPMVVVRAIDEAAELGDGTMGSPDDARELALTFEVFTDAVTGFAAVDAVNDLDQAIGEALGVATQPGTTLDGLLTDFRWASTITETNAEQERYLAQAIITYTATYHVYFGDPV